MIDIGITLESLSMNFMILSIIGFTALGYNIIQCIKEEFI